jgi:hypothetical protein
MPDARASAAAGASSSSPLTTRLSTGFLSSRAYEQAGNLPDLFLALSPRPSVRVDRRARGGGWLHSYHSRPLPASPPAAPWAVHLADNEGRFRWVVFDLDAGRGEVGPDLATLLRWLEDAGLTYVVAASGPGGGRHVWLAAVEPLDALVVASLGRAAARRLPTLDYGLLCNPATGAARPVGAPHRDGGRSRLLHPETERHAAAHLDPAACGNSAEAFTRLLLAVGGPEDPGPVRLPASRTPGAEVVEDREGPRLAGTPRTVLDEETLALLVQPPSADRVSETLAALLVRLALRRWTWPMVERLLGERRHRRGGLLHACTRAGRDGRRRLTEPETVAKLARQWARCVRYAARLPATTGVAEDGRESGRDADAVTAMVERVQAAADAVPKRWASAAGPADRAALDLMCLLGLQAGTSVLDCDVRRAALATGHGRSTMHRALVRLVWDGWLKACSSEGPAGTWELLDPSAEQGGTQVTPPPAASARGRWAERLEVRLAAVRADLFAYGRPGLGRCGGLGHHAGRVYQPLVEFRERPLSLAELCERTGYTAATVARHLARMRDLMAATRAVLTVHHECPRCRAVPGERCTVYGRRVARRHGDVQHGSRKALARARADEVFYRGRRGALTAAARALGAHGRAAARARRYAVEIELYHWWRKEEVWMRAPKAGVGVGPRVHHGQRELLVSTLPQRPWRRYPRMAGGRADHQAARSRIEARIAFV